MEEKEYDNIFFIPANYTDSGKLLGGMLEVRNAIETVILAAFLGYPELMLISALTKSNAILSAPLQVG